MSFKFIHSSDLHLDSPLLGRDRYEGAPVAEMTVRAVLEKFLGKIAVKPADTEFEHLYVNGSHTLTDPLNKVHLIEEAFQRLMFDDGNFESLE
jgi:hypothetical protein